MTRALRAPIVGLHFNPPSKALCAGLRKGAEVRLVPEPENSFDNQAIWVIWPTVQPESMAPAEVLALDATLPDFGIDGVGELTQSPEWMLGHIAKSGGKPLAKLALLDPSLVGNAELLQSFIEWPQSGTLDFLSDGTPVVVLELD